MLPIRFASSGLARRLLGWTFLLLLGAVVPGPVGAVPLAAVGVDDFRALIGTNRDPKPEPAVAGSVLADYRRKLRKAAKELPSLGEVSRVLLLSEWASADFEFGEKVPLDQVKKAVEQPSDDAFQRDVQKMMAAHPDNTEDISDALVSEIKRDVRLQMLRRLETRVSFYLTQGRVADRIAAANLISDTMTTSRRQDISQYRTETGVVVPGVVMKKQLDETTESSKYLRKRLRELGGDLEKLLAHPDSQVRTAAIRALSNLEKEPADLVAILKPFLAEQQSDALTRQAAAEALGHILDVSTTTMDKSRPLPYLKSVDLILPIVANGLTDADARVRRASLEACQQAALVLDELASDPLASSDRAAVFRPTMAVVDSVLPKLNASARDPIPELRVGASHVLESIALAIYKLGYYKGTPLPPRMELPQDRRRKKKVSLPPSRSPVGQTRRAAAPRSGNTLVLVQAAAGRAAPPDELPAPLPVDVGLQATVRAMIDNLKHADYRVRLAAVDTLETFGGQAEAAIPSLVTALCDYNKFVRWSAARTLGRLHPRRADEVVPGLTRLLDDREDPSVRIAAASAIELYGEHAKKAVPALARVINRGDKEYIVAILHAIQGIGTDAAPALPNVAWVLSDRTQPPSVRIEAAQTLGRFGELAIEQLPILRDVMNNDPDEDVRNAASIAVLAVDRPIK